MNDVNQLLAERAELGRILGLDGPVSEPVLRAALADSAYATNLLTCRRRPDLLRLLLDRPPSRPNADVPVRELLAGAAGALARWARTGFTVVDAETYSRRIGACKTCPELTVAGAGLAQRLLHAVSSAGLDDKAVCGLCGCPAVRKARLTSEKCPARDPADPHLTRWGEPADPTT